MALTPSDPLERAAAAARDAEPEGWPAVADTVKHRLRSVVMPSRPIVMVGPDGSLAQDEHDSRTFVASRVLVSRLREELRTSPDLTAERIDLTIDEDDRLTRVVVDVVCAYGTVLPAAAEVVRSLVESVAAELLGAGTAPLVDVTVTDVVAGDPRVV